MAVDGPKVTAGGTCSPIYDHMQKLIQSGPSKDEIFEHIKCLNFCSRVDNVREHELPKMSDEDCHRISET